MEPCLTTIDDFLWQNAMNITEEGDENGTILCFLCHCILVWAKQGQDVERKSRLSMIVVTGWQVVQTGFPGCSANRRSRMQSLLHQSRRLNIQGLEEADAPFPRLAIIGIMTEFSADWRVSFHQPTFLFRTLR